MAKDDSAHVVNVGRLVEEMEGKMRNMLQEVYFGKTRDVVGDLRSEFASVCQLIRRAVLPYLWKRLNGNNMMTLCANESICKVYNRYRRRSGIEQHRRRY